MTATTPKFSPTRSAELLALAERATAGPWLALESTFSPEARILGPTVRVDDDENAGRDTIAIVPLSHECAWGTPHEANTLDQAQTEANFCFIIAAPDLAAQHRTAVEVIKRVLPYARHKEDCKSDVMPGKFRTCTCGLSEALSMVGE